MSNSFLTIAGGGFAELKNYYQGPMKDQLNEDCVILRGAEKVKQGWSGYQVIRPLRVRRNQGIGATSDGGPLPAIGNQVTQQAQISAKFNYVRAGVTGPMIKASQSDIGSFVRSAAYELEMGYKDSQSDVNRQLGWDGTGTLATVNTAATASTSLVIQGRESVEAALKFVDVGLVFDLVSAGAVVQSAITVNSISSGTPSSLTATLVCNQPVTASVGYTLIRSGSLNNEIQGLLYSEDGGTTTIYNINRAVYLSYQGNVNDLAAGQLSLDGMQNAYNAGLRRGGAKYSAIECDYDSLRFYQKLLTADKRFNNTIEGDGGFAKKDKFYLDFNGIPIVPDKDSPQRFFFLSEDSLKMYVLAEMEFADETGSMYIVQTGVDAFEIRIRYFANLFNEQPNANAVVKNYISP
jgi:hypothetical protein